MHQHENILSEITISKWQIRNLFNSIIAILSQASTTPGSLIRCVGGVTLVLYRHHLLQGMPSPYQLPLAIGSV